MLATTDICTLYAPIVRVLGYYDVFNYPLREEEIHLFLPVHGVSSYELRGTVAELVADGKLIKDRGYYYLPHQTGAIVDRRIAMEQEGRRMWRAALRVAAVMRFVPFVQGVFVSGQLCRYIADQYSDIDYFIVTAPGRLWIARTILVAIRRIFLLNSRKYFCTNYYVSADNLRVRERNAYVVCEVASLKPLYNRGLFNRFMRENSWIKEFYPNFTMEQVEIRRTVEGGERLRGFLERLLPSHLATKLDIRLMMMTRNFWRRKFPGIDPRAYDGALRTRRDESRAHPNDQAPKVLTMYRARLAQYGISDE
ncbi:MAG TPA: hypothetical protein VHI13_10610 [Candidatus Kapabacteria bacterium]|nr:hypothetical protein [Candidatus Kapabacteria bacterium]